MSNNRIDIVGQTYNDLEVLEYSHTGKWGVAFWKCKCKCGNIKNVRGPALKNGLSKSCGCSKLEYNKKRTNSYQPNQIVNDTVTLLSIIDKDSKNRTVWKCLCHYCGVEFEAKSPTLSNRKSCGCMKINNLKGLDNPNYNPNLSDEERMVLQNRYYLYRQECKDWSKSVFHRDRYKCQVTGRTDDIVAHHLYSWHTHPNLRFDICNGITLTRDIHKQFHSEYGYKENTPEQFTEFQKSRSLN